MNYRLDTKVRPLIWIECHRDIKSHSRVEYMVKAKSEFKKRSTANNVEILVPVPVDADSPKFKVSIGTAEYLPDTNCIRWNIKQFNGQKEYLMRAHFGLPSVSAADAGQEDTEEKAPIRVKFEIPYFTVSGIQVRCLILKKERKIPFFICSASQLLYKRFEVFVFCFSHNLILTNKMWMVSFLSKEIKFLAALKPENVKNWHF
ncbi:hypothetical protein RFI_30173 [Reticulomyxa filosa]|uniref:MHD domain-containing protein n=1 Tax=Reticulomyxa filosa TaxID=46433 RepID=X6M005_RETFI|nr:hypothetical protein RFI_30173 [Reticulomyxa filosa]|eukprot:ETO07219.1 hypothetical protein RFI_30173 [Reticulomyxa filosa]